MDRSDACATADTTAASNTPAISDNLKLTGRKSIQTINISGLDTSRQNSIQNENSRILDRIYKMDKISESFPARPLILKNSVNSVQKVFASLPLVFALPPETSRDWGQNNMATNSLNILQASLRVWSG